MTILAALFIGLILGSLMSGGMIYLRSKKHSFALQVELAKALEQVKAQEVLIQNMEQMRQQMQKDFENLSFKMMQRAQESFARQSGQGLDVILKPFSERLKELQQKIDDSYQVEAKERYVLKDVIERMGQLNQKMAQETENLTKALKGDVKAQGNWGELILEKILENSGLRKGFEYNPQAAQMGLKDEEGKVARPDIIVNLPDNKHIIIDSKVSLVSYEAMGQAQEAKEQQQHFKLFYRSLQEHIRGLSEKKYHHLDKLNAPEFVLMFIPIEGAFACALSPEENNDLFSFAWDRKVIMVGPTTLLATLKTVASVWKQENQTKNSIEIARQAGALYDDFVRLVQEMRELQDIFSKASSMQSKILARIEEGRGNLMTRSQKIKALGAKNSKELAPELLSQINLE